MAAIMRGAPTPSDREVLTGVVERVTQDAKSVLGILIRALKSNLRFEHNLANLVDCNIFSSVLVGIKA
jgi:hypothetical protein